MRNKISLISGCNGQDGSYLSELLLDKGYKVHGMIRRSSVDTTERIAHLISNPNFELVEGDVTDASCMHRLISGIKPDEVYNLAAMSHVGISFDQPITTCQIDAVGPLNILEAIRQSSPESKFYQACHDTETKVVTVDGVKSYDEVCTGDRVYTLNELTGCVEIKRVIKKLVYDYDGKMVSLKGRMINQSVTPNHSILLRSDDGRIVRERADNVASLFPDSRTSEYSIPMTSNHLSENYASTIAGKSTNKLYASDINHVSYSGKVWCLSMEDNHNFLISRGGKLAFSGNSTSELFGDTDVSPQNENTPFNPNSPYALAKLYAHHLVGLYRRAYGIFACAGILFNHESPRRGENFVTRKVTKYVAQLSKIFDDAYRDGDRGTTMNLPKLSLGNLDAKRDWSFAGDMVYGMWLMLQQDEPDDYVLGSGKTYSIRELLRVAFRVIGIEDYSYYVTIDKKFCRPVDVNLLCADPAKAKKILGWESTTSFDELIYNMVKADRRILGCQD